MALPPVASLQCLVLADMVGGAALVSQVNGAMGYPRTVGKKTASGGGDGPVVVLTDYTEPWPNPTNPAAGVAVVLDAAAIATLTPAQQALVQPLPADWWDLTAGGP